MSKMILDREQDAAVWAMQSSPTSSALNGSVVGRGKTVMTVELAERIGAQSILIVAPLGTRTGWAKTFKIQESPLSFNWINSTVKGKAALASFLAGEPGIKFIGIEFFTRLGFTNGASTDLWKKAKADMVIVDEMHRFSNRKTKAFRVLKQVKAGYKLGLSGTPSGNFAVGAWSITRFLFPDHTDTSYYRFVADNMETVYDPFTFNNQRVVGEKNPGAYYSSMPCYVRLENEVNVPIVKETRYVELSTKQRKTYDDLEKDLVAWLDDNPLICDLPIAVRTRLRQVSLGELTIREDGVVDFPAGGKSTKLDALDDIIAGDLDGESALILTDSAKFAVRTEERLRAAGHTVARWDGSVSQANREQHKIDFVAGKTRFLVAVIAAIGEGVDGLQFGTRNMVYLSHSDSGIMGEQSEARVARRGVSGTVRRWDIEAIDTLDSGQFSSLIQQRLDRAAHLRVTEIDTPIAA